MRILTTLVIACVAVLPLETVHADKNVSANLSASIGRMSLKNVLPGPSNLGVDAKPKEESRYFGLNFQAYLSDRFSVLASAGIARDFRRLDSLDCVDTCEPRYSQTPLHTQYVSIGLGYDILRIENFTLLASARRTRNEIIHSPHHHFKHISNSSHHSGNELGAMLRWELNDNWFIDAEWTRLRFEYASRSARQDRAGIAIGFNL